MRTLSVIAFTGPYDETLNMMREARDYVAGRRGAVWQAGGRELAFNVEALRVTSRLTQVMAWLMIQRAVNSGEISLAEACRPHYRLGGQEVCLDVSRNADPCLPTKLRSLMARSHNLYQRVARLQEGMLPG